MWRRPSAVIGGFMVMAAAAAVTLNALTFQTKRHPAPLFAPKSGQASAAAPIATPAPLPPTRPAPTSVTAPQSLPVARPPASKQDPIGDMIRAGDGARGIDAKAEPHRPVAAAQR